MSDLPGYVDVADLELTDQSLDERRLAREIDMDPHHAAGMAP